jgi:hypothetical protein
MTSVGVRRGLANAARFILCAVPGAFVLLIAPLALIAERIPPSRHRALEIAAGIATIPIAAALILYGTNNWGKWGYVLPIIAVLPCLLAPGRVSAPVSFALLALPFVTAWGVRKYYRRRAQNE